MYIYVPFISGYHASPYDFQRYTLSGLESLCGDFEIIESGVSAGPTSGMLWIAQEWLAMLLSFGFTPLYRILFVLIMLITWPIKYLDIIMAHHPMAKNIASSFYVIAKKPKS